MKTIKLPGMVTRGIDRPLPCTVIFLYLFKGLFIAMFFINYSSWSSYVYLFCLGWFCWTFFEYMLHRFIWHNKNEHKRALDQISNHAHHHTHPSEIKLSNANRFLFLGITLACAAAAIWLNNYFTLAAGFIWGLTFYSFMHRLLHTKVAQKIFPKLVRYHIYHHCKYPDKCFGISVTWWDDLFRTVPSDSKTISSKVIDFYFGEKQANNPAIAQKVLVNMVIIFSVIHPSMSQNTTLAYDVLRNNTVIGSLTATEKISGNKTFLLLNSNVKTRFIISYSSHVDEAAVFENGAMIYSYFYKKENGDETRKSMVTSGNRYRLINNGAIDSQNYFPVNYNYIQMFLQQPDATTTQVYSNNYEQFLPVERVSSNKYRIQLPNGDYNYYTYSNGQCTQVDIKRTLFTLHFKLRKNIPMKNEK